MSRFENGNEQDKALAKGCEHGGAEPGINRPDYDLQAVLTKGGLKQENTQSKQGDKDDPRPLPFEKCPAPWREAQAEDKRSDHTPHHPLA